MSREPIINSAAESGATISPVLAPGDKPSQIPVISALAGWTLHEYEVVTSTNLVAANLPAWHAVRANTQTAGRGRFQRTWISDAGGLWLSAVVPLGQDALERTTLPLAAGVAVYSALETLGIAQVRLRWPNDVMVNDRKLAGLLVDQFTPGRAVAGIGVNVSNNPELLDWTLKHQTTRLADLLSAPPKVIDLAVLILGHLRHVLSELRQSGAPALFARVNQLWGKEHIVELDLNGTFRRGQFKGVDGQGRLVLCERYGQFTYYDAPTVRHLTEI